MSRKIEHYFKKVDPKKEEKSAECMLRSISTTRSTSTTTSTTTTSSSSTNTSKEGVEKSNNISFGSNLETAENKTLLEDDGNKGNNSTEFSDDDSLYQAVQLDNIVEDSATEPKVCSAITATNFNIKGTFFGNQSTQGKSLLLPHSNSTNKPKHKFHFENKKKTNSDNSRDNRHMGSCVNAGYIGAELKNRKDHKVLIDTKVFVRDGLIRVYPNEHIPYVPRETAAILPYCYREDCIKPFHDDGGVGGHNDGGGVGGHKDGVGVGVGVGGHNDGGGVDGNKYGGGGSSGYGGVGGSSGSYGVGGSSGSYGVGGSSGSGVDFSNNSNSVKGVGGILKDGASGFDKLGDSVDDVDNICDGALNHDADADNNVNKKNNANKNNDGDVDDGEMMDDDDDGVKDSGEKSEIFSEYDFEDGSINENNKIINSGGNDDDGGNDDNDGGNDDDDERINSTNKPNDESCHVNESFNKKNKNLIENNELLKCEIKLDDNCKNANRNNRNEGSRGFSSTEKFKQCEREAVCAREAVGAREAVCARELITDSVIKLKSAVPSSASLLAETIQSYQTTKRDFRGLQSYINQLSKEERKDFFVTILPNILSLVISTSEVITQPIPILKRRSNAMVTMSQMQAACILANAFMCTFKPRTTPSKFNTINFFGLFSGAREGKGRSQRTKLHCLLNYFKRVATHINSYDQRGLISIERKCDVNRMDERDWSVSSQSLSSMTVKREGCIEDASGMLQVDFANKFIGGGVLRGGAVQEEIRFCICPEAIVSCLIAEKMDDDECIILRGCEQFSSYKGYGRSFEFKSDFEDNTKRDGWKRMKTDIVAIDAVHFHKTSSQFNRKFVLRELNKAYCGFSRSTLQPHPHSTLQPHPSSSSHPHSTLNPPTHLPPIATGNWGCGAFNGNLQLKAMIQLLAASMAGRQLQYYVFHEEAFASQLLQVCSHLDKISCNTGQLFNILVNYWPQGDPTPSYDLFTFIHNHSF